MKLYLSLALLIPLSASCSAIAEHPGHAAAHQILADDQIGAISGGPSSITTIIEQEAVAILLDAFQPGLLPETW
jgi:hypothetical protein